MSSDRGQDAGASVTGGFSSIVGVQRSTHWQGPDLIGLPAHLQTPIARLLAAFDEPTVLGLSVAREAPGHELAFSVVHVRFGDGGGWGFGVDLTAPVAEVLEAIAFGIQEHLPEQQETWAQPRPQCPGHPHEMVVRVLDGSACWVCPRTGASVRAVA